MSLKLWVTHLISRKPQKSEDCLNLEENYDEVFICHKIRQMCFNWLYLNNPEKVKTMDIQTYRKETNKLFSMLRSSSYLHDIIFPMFNEVKTTRDFYDNGIFEKIQTQVFKFLNILSKKSDLEKDFCEVKDGIEK